MSRICIKNLPKHASEDRLREFFSQKGEVTDAKLIRTTDGKSRQFGFIGYRTEEEAESAIKYFNNSFMDTCRITCEIARKAGDENLPRSWSKYSGKKIDVENKENSKKISSKKIKREDKKEEKSDDPLLQEFLEVMKPRSKSQLWANDTVTEQNNIKKKKIEKSDDSDEEEDDTSSIHNQSDMDYFKSRVKKDFSDSEIDEDESKSEVKELTEHEDEISSPRLFIRNLPYTTSEEELEDHFSKYGKLSEVHIVVDKETKRSKGIAYILYSDLDSATRALDELDNSTFQGRLLHVMPAKQKNPEKQEIDTLTKSKTFKQKREDERKASELNGNTQAWNSLFIRPDTVVENLARKYGVSKRDFLDKEADDLAVRIALGETQVISETKKALTKFGINVSSLEDFANGKSKDLKRSNHVILVKNLPYGSSESELANLFGKFGSLDKVILPNTKTLALVIFLEANEARSAFRGLAYKRYKDAPLYLEWAPEDILVKNFSIDNEELKSGLDYQIEEFNEEIDPDRIESRSIYVKNLNFKTSDESLKKHFIDHMKEGKLLSARVKKHLKNGKNVSMGFGFIEFDSVDTALNICKDLKGTVLDGHALILQLCHAKEEKVVKKKGDNDKSSTKLIVRNVAFEATVKDLRQLFSPFGQIKRLRLPMRFENHRGFAFVEYMTKQETLNALQALSNTHLYGRHLVLERAKEGESLEELRERTAAQFSDNLSSGKVSKKRDHLAAFNEGNDKF